jgi:ankyrin repeat protein
MSEYQTILSTLRTEMERNGSIGSLDKLPQAGLKEKEICFFLAVMNNKKELVLRLLDDQELTANLKNNKPIQIAAEHGLLEIAKILIARGADVTANNNFALRIAAYEGHAKMVQLLLENGADVHADEEIAIQYTARYGFADITKILIAFGADIHTGDENALQLAVKYGHTEVVQNLLAAGANIHAKKDNALQLAAKYNHCKIIELLLRHGIDVHADSDNALKLAINYNNIAAVELLLAHGAHPNYTFHDYDDINNDIKKVVRAYNAYHLLAESREKTIITNLVENFKTSGKYFLNIAYDVLSDLTITHDNPLKYFFEQAKN